MTVQKKKGTGKHKRKNQCILDDIVNEFLEIAGDYDGFVFGTPVHWGGAGGAITSFMDRVFYADLNGGGDRFRLKPAAVVISARRAGTTATWDQVNKYLGLMQILGNNMAYFINCKNVATKMGIEMPKAPDFVFTNFIR